MARPPALFLTEGQLADAMGISTDILQSALPSLSKSGFPAPDPLMKDRRYWPACKLFLDKRYGLAPSSLQGNPALDGDEKW